MNKQIIIGIVAAVVVIGGLVVFSMNQSKNEVASDKMTGDAMMSGEEKMTGDAAMMQQNKMEQDKMAADKMTGDAMMSSEEKMTGDAMMAKNGMYKEYSATTVEAEQKAGNKVVLFFHAAWCPDCKKADAAFKASPESIPAGVTVLKTDYDTTQDLKKKYAITTQHTFVQIDASENQVTKWIGGDISMLMKNIK